MGIGAFSVFLPTFIKEFGFSIQQTQLYSMIPYVFALFSHDQLVIRRRPVGAQGPPVTCLSVSCVGFIMLPCVTNKVALMAVPCFVAAGAYPGLIIGVAFTIPTQGGYTKRVTSVWIMLDSEEQTLLSSLFVGRGELKEQTLLSSLLVGRRANCPQGLFR